MAKSIYTIEERKERRRARDRARHNTLEHRAKRRAQYAADPELREKRKTKCREYYAEHANELTAAKRAERAANPEKFHTKDKARYQKLRLEKPEQLREYGRKGSKRYYAKHRQSSEFLFATHRNNAEARGIPFLLTYEEWMDTWTASGHWEQRGTKRGQYVMARPGDQGPYEVGNISIVLAEDNRAERNANYPMRDEDNPAAGKNYWADHTPEERQAHATKISARLLGKSKGPQMSTRLSATLTGRRRVTRDGRITWAYPGDHDYPQK